MKRRDFSTKLLSATTLVGAAALSRSPLAQAQVGPVEGRHYVRLGRPVPVAASGKIEVVEFFWYGCPSCNAFEPLLETWIKRLPPDVAFRRVPVAFRQEPFTAHQKIFFALEAMGQVDAMQRKVFYAIHNDRARLDKPADIAAFMARNGVDGEKFMALYNSFSVQTKTAQARKLAEAYQIDGVPALGVQGRFYTSGAMAGDLPRALAVADHLIQLARKNA
jgi:thiol:disulfide interchange protein DsbA